MDGGLDLDAYLADALAKEEHYRARREELKEEIASLDAQERELARGVTAGLVHGFATEKVRGKRRAIREELDESTRALVELDALEAGAVEDVSALEKEIAGGAYWTAREAEAVAVGALEKALVRLAPLLEGVHSAGQASYSRGLEAGLETSRHRQRRGFIVENFLGTVLGAAYPTFLPQNRLRVSRLAERLAELLPAIGTDDGRGEG